jgi:hypothetical protein
MKMIGVLCSADEVATAAEFFQLFKTPWEPFVAGRDYDVVIATVPSVPETDAALLLVFGSGPCSVDTPWGIQPDGDRQGTILELGGTRLPAYGRVLTFKGAGSVRVCDLAEDRRGLRLGYDLFKEVDHLLSAGQPLEHAAIPTLDLHIDAVRRWILEAGLELVEIPPVPAGTSFTVCLTHDIDFVGIRRHVFDHTMFGFLHRATIGAAWSFCRGRISLGRLTRCWAAAASLPLVHFGLAKDFWLPFEWYLELEKDLGATYYIIPFKRRVGEKVSAPHAARRASAYDVGDISEWIPRLQQAGCEVGVHGIDAWHSVTKGKEERRRVGATGIRMHWLLSDGETFRVLEEAGYDYDSTAGYNDTVGYRAGTGQVYRPTGARRLLELPLHIQDGALFNSERLDVSERQAWKLCSGLIRHARAHGGVLTLLWHDRSHGPERFWGEFYARLVGELKTLDVWFGRAEEVVDWYRARRAVVFERRPAAGQIAARMTGQQPGRPFVLRKWSGTTHGDEKWSGEDDAVWAGETGAVRVALSAR